MALLALPALMICTLLAGCIMMRGHNVELPPTWPLQKEAAAKSIRIKISEDKMNESYATGDLTVSKQGLKAYTESGLFSE